jgi:DNA-directed RNA polymerase specialized sigma24 family protein
VPSEAEIQAMLEKPSKVKGSRIDRALNKLREEQAQKSETASNFELTSKSKILEKM